MSAVYRQSFSVHSYDVDPRGLLSPRALCAYLQEVAGRHAEQLGVSMERLGEGGLAWVLRRLRLELRRGISERERLEVTTWPSGADGVLARREFELRDASGEAAGVASSQWVVVDVAARTVVRLPPAVLALEPATRAATLTLDRRPLPSAELWALQAPVVVRRGDLDVVGHVNNTRYVEWLWESLPDEVWSGRRLTWLEIVFLGEARHGDRVLSRSAPAAEEGAQLLHSLVDASGRELARALSAWTP